MVYWYNYTIEGNQQKLKAVKENKLIEIIIYHVFID